jgi:hypothetical protein
VYLDDTNLPRLVSGTVNPITGIATFSRDDGTDFDVDFSGLLGDSNHSHHNKTELDKIQDGDVDKWNGAPSAPADSSSTIYVSKEGSDLSSGLNINNPKETITAAINDAATLLSEGASNVNITILDGERYTEDLTIPNDVHIIGHACELVGNHTMANNTSLFVHTLYRGGSGNMVNKTEQDGHAHIRCFVADTRGVDGTITGGAGFRNASNGAVLHIQCDVLYVAENAIGLTDGSGGNDFGHLHFLGSDIYLAGNGAMGCRTGSSGSKILIVVGHILESGEFNNTTAADLNSNGSKVWITANQIQADDAWDVNNGDLYITCPDITGDRHGDAANLMLGTADVKIDWVGTQAEYDDLDQEIKDDPQYIFNIIE